MKLGTAKICKHVQGDKWCTWSGWISGRNVEITPVTPDALLDRIVPSVGQPTSSVRDTPWHDGGPAWSET